MMEKPPDSPNPEPNAARPAGAVPQGVGLLLKLASVDPQFRERLLEQRADVAEETGLPLTDAEAAMLRAAPREQLEAIIAQTVVPQEHRRALLENATAALLGIWASEDNHPEGPRGTGIAPDRPMTRGISPDRPQSTDAPGDGTAWERPFGRRLSFGIRPDKRDPFKPKD